MPRDPFSASYHRRPGGVWQQPGQRGDEETGLNGIQESKTETSPTTIAFSVVSRGRVKSTTVLLHEPNQVQCATRMGSVGGKARRMLGSTAPRVVPIVLRNGLGRRGLSLGPRTMLFYITLFVQQLAF